MGHLIPKLSFKSFKIHHNGNGGNSKKHHGEKHSKKDTYYIQKLERILKENEEKQSCFRKNSRKKLNDILEHMYKKIKKADVYGTNMAYIWENYLYPNLGMRPERLDLTEILQNDQLESDNTVHTFITAITTLSQDRQIKIISGIVAMVESSCGCKCGKTCRKKALALQQNGPTDLISKCEEVARLYLPPVHLTCKALRSIYNWLKGKITGKECVKNILRSFRDIAYMGAYMGVHAGFTIIEEFDTLIIPGLGTEVGSFFNFLGEVTVTAFVGWISEKLFDLPQDEALKNAYDWMDHLPCNASNEDIKDRYRELCLRYHPDKGGQQEDFQKLQCCMGVIKASKQDA